MAGLESASQMVLQTHDTSNIWPSSVRQGILLLRSCSIDSFDIICWGSRSIGGTSWGIQALQLGYTSSVFLYLWNCCRASIFPSSPTVRTAIYITDALISHLFLLCAIEVLPCTPFRGYFRFYSRRSDVCLESCIFMFHHISALPLGEYKQMAENWSSSLCGRREDSFKEYFLFY